MNPKECQQIGCHLDASMDEFEHFAHHRTLLIDIRANIAHEIGLEGRDYILVKDNILVRGKEYPILSTCSQQDIAYFYESSKLTSINSNECQPIGYQSDARMDEFQHFAHHRRLLLDIRANIAHEISLVGRDDILEKDYVLVRGKG